MLASPGCSARNRRVICCGDHNNSRSVITRRHNRSLVPNFVGFGRRARSPARRCAVIGAYPSRPPLACTSRDTVDVARPILAAIAVNDWPSSRPTRISTRSSSDNLAGDGSHRISLRRTPPNGLSTAATTELWRPNSRPICRQLRPCDANRTIRRRSPASIRLHSRFATTASSSSSNPAQLTESLR